MERREKTCMKTRTESHEKTCTQTHAGNPAGTCVKTKALGKEQISLCVLGFFVGRAVCFEFNPLVAAFWIATKIGGVSSGWLLVCILFGLFSRTGLTGVVPFLVFVFLQHCAFRAFFLKSGDSKETQQSTEDSGVETKHRVQESQKNAKVSQANIDRIRLLLLSSICLFVAGILMQSLFPATENQQLLSITSFSSLWTSSSLWSNQRQLILMLCEALLESILSAVVAYLLLEGFSRKDWQLIEAGGVNRKLFIAGAILLAVVLYGLPGSMYATFAIAEAISYLSIMCVAYTYGTLESTLVAALSGAVLAYQLNDFSVIATVTLFGVVAGVFKEMGRIGVLCSVAAVALFVYFGIEGTSLAANSIKGLVTAGIIFLFLPRRLLQQQNVDETAVMDLMQEQIGKSLREKMREFSGGFWQLQRGLTRVPKPETAFDDQDYSRMYMQMKETVCDQCEDRYRCYYASPNETFAAAKSVFQALEQKGGIEAEDIPESFAAVCCNQKAFLLGANQSFERAKSNQLVSQKLAESREILAEQVADVALMMNEFSSELVQDYGRDESREMLLRLKLKTRQVQVRQVFVWKRDKQPDVLYVVAQCRQGSLMTAKELATHISSVYHRSYRPTDSCKSVVTKTFEVYSFIEDAKYTVIKGVKRVPFEADKNGDNYSYVQLENGEFVAMLSDGMGTGAQAYDVSAMLVELLEEFLEAGFGRESALRLANSVLALDFGGAIYATLDFFHIDLFTGIGHLIKIGAAATFVKRQEQVEMIVSTSLPAGVFGILEPDAVELHLKDGDLIVMVSDGVMDAVIVEEKEQYIKELLMEMDEQSPQEIAEQLIEQVRATGLNRVKDDMTVLAFSVWSRR